jgi:hypothetical protein
LPLLGNDPRHRPLPGPAEPLGMLGRDKAPYAPIPFMTPKKQAAAKDAGK